MIAWLLEDILKMTEGFHQTSTVENPKYYSVTFAKNIEWYKRLFDTDKELWTLIPLSLKEFEVPREVALKIRPIAVPDVVQLFTLFHNKVNAKRVPKCNVWGDFIRIHPSAVIGVAGMRYVRTETGTVFMKHMGNVVVKDGVEVGPYTVIHRAIIDSTIIGRKTRIGALVNIGHNVVIGDETFITPRVVIGGSTRIGNNCWIGMGSTIRDHIRICSGVKIGMGAVVTKSINDPGVYVGCPARKIGEWDGNL